MLKFFYGDVSAKTRRPPVTLPRWFSAHDSGLVIICNSEEVPLKGLEWRAQREVSLLSGHNSFGVNSRLSAGAREAEVQCGV